MAHTNQTNESSICKRAHCLNDFPTLGSGNVESETNLGCSLDPDVNEANRPFYLVAARKADRDIRDVVWTESYVKWKFQLEEYVLTGSASASVANSCITKVLPPPSRGAHHPHTGSVLLTLHGGPAIELGSLPCPSLPFTSLRFA